MSTCKERDNQIKSLEFSPDIYYYKQTIIPKFLFLFLFLFIFCENIFALTWKTKYGTDDPTNSAVSLDVNRNFDLLYGGGGNSIYGDFVATGDSILYVPDTYSSYMAFANSTYMQTDSSFNSHVDSRKRNSSTATLNLPSYVEGKHIVFAGLFWQGMVHENIGNGLTTADVDSNIAGWNEVTFKTPDGVMHNLSASLISKTSASNTYNYSYKDDNSFHHHYSAFVDVTTLVKNTYSSSDNNFTTGHILTTAGTDFGDSMYFAYEPDKDGLWVNGSVLMGNYGGWSLIVTYSLDAETASNHPEEKLKNVSIYDGYDQFAIWVNTDPLLVSIDIDNFLTPKSGTIDSRLLIFGGAGDYNIAGDQINMLSDNTGNMETISNSLNPAGSQFNSSYTNLNQPLSSKTIRNGVDLDIFDVSSKMGYDQSSTTIQFGVQQTGSGAGQIHPQVLAFSTQLYEPSFCYDYGYKQNEIFFTEENNGTALPRITGQVTNNDDINITIFLRNLENSDISAKNMNLDITDINTTQAIYKRETTSVLLANQVNPNSIDDSTLVVADDYIKNIDLGDIEGQDYIFTYYTLTPNLPTELNNEINVSINATFSYDLEIPQPDGSIITLPYTGTLGSSKLPMCSGDNNQYAVDWGLFNVAAKGIYTGDTNPIYNIPTQVVKRPGEFLVTSHDANSSPIPYIDELNISTVVGVELIATGKYQSTQTSCDEPSSAISPRVTMNFDNNSQIDLLTELNEALSDGRLQLGSIEDYFSEAKENTAFRISFNVPRSLKDGVIQTETLANGEVQILNFPQLIGINGGNCLNNVYKNPTETEPSVKKIPVACENAGVGGGSSLDAFELQQCMDCIFGINSINMCSRDNFSIRPESFNIKLSDVNQTNSSQKVKFAEDRTGIAIPSTNNVNIASGYNYNIEINATNHLNNSAALGYNQNFSNVATSDHNLTFIWNPKSITQANATTFCNDLNSYSININMSDGASASDSNISIQNIGEYQLNMVDTSWTDVDSDTSIMLHHKIAPIDGLTYNVSTFFADNGNAIDCELNSSIVQNSTVLPSYTNPNLVNINGCIINTDSHDNLEANLKYRDYNITAHPYKFNLDNLIISQGADENQTLNSFVYTSNVDDNDSRDMALHVRGVFAAQGWNNIALNNFVTGCYAKDVNLTLNRNMEPIVEAYVARFTDRNSSTDVISDVFVDINASNSLFTVLDSNFTKDMNGAIDMELDLNFEKNITVPREPINITLNDFNISCAIGTECQFQADLISNKETNGTRDLNDANLTHYYGRVHAPDYEFEGTTDDATIFYEVYCENCDKTQYNVSIVESPDSVFWYLNNLHTVVEDGEVTTYSTLSNVTFNGNPTSSTGAITAGTETQILVAPETPYVDRVQMTPDPWLIYNRFSNTAQTNDFNVKFLSTSGNWAGEGTLGQTIDLNVSTIQNKRLDW